MSDSKPVILVTGGSRGLGRGICLKLSESGYSVIINFVGNAEAAEKTVAECQDRKTRSGQKFIALQADIGKKDSRQNLIDEWAAPIGESIVANWDFSEDIQATLNPDEVETTRRRSEANLADNVTTAKVSLNGAEPELHDTAEAKRLQLTEEQMPAIMESFQKKLDSLASAVR